MNKLLLLLCFQLFAYQSILAQDFDNLSFGTENTLEIATWNIENFPKNGTITIDYVSNIIEALDVDIIAIQEVDNIASFNTLVSNLSSYEGYLESVWFAGLAYIYKSDTIEINDIYEIYTTAEFWNYFPRSPMVMDLNYMGQQYIIINNHYKCCGDGNLDLTNNNDEETRRYFANVLLKEYVDTNFATDNVIILGDLNDILIDEPDHNVFQMFLDDDFYLFADFNIASGEDSNWSFPSWPSHLDHILITNTLFDAFEADNSDIQTIKIDEHLPGGWDEYDDNVSDHRPVALKLDIEPQLSITDNDILVSQFINYPNPFSTDTRISFQTVLTPSAIKIYNLKGQQILTVKINEGQNSVTLKTGHLSNGIYIAKLIENNRVLANRKLVIMK